MALNDFTSPIGSIFGADPSTLPITSELETQALDHLDSRIRELGNYIRTLFERFDSSTTRKNILKLVEDSRKAYYQETTSTSFPWANASNMISPLTTMGVDEVEPRLVNAVIGKEPYIKAKPLKGASTKEEAQQITDFDNFVLEHLVKVKALVPQLIHEKLIDGTIYPLLSWETKTKKVKRIVQDPTSPNGWSRQVQEYTTNGPCIELVPIEYVWHEDHLNDENWESAPVIRYVGNITIGEILDRVEQGETGWINPKGGEIPDRAEFQKILESYVATEILKTTQQETESTQDYFLDFQPRQKPIEFYEAYIKFDFMGEDQRDENLIVLVEKSTFTPFRIREQIEVIDENIKPLRRQRFLKRRGVSWGYPLYTLIAGIQLGVDAMWNRCVNSADVTMTPWGFIKRGMSGLLSNKPKIYPGALNEVEGNPEDSIYFPNLQMFQPQQFIPLIMQYISFFERTLNVSDFMQGRESQIVGKKGSTATGTLAILQEGKIKFEYRGGLTHLEFLDLFKNIHDLCVSNMPIEEHIKITGAPITQYSCSDLYLFKLVGSDLVSNRFTERQEVESLAMLSQQFIQLGVANPIPVYTDVLNSYKATTDREPEEYIDPELAAMIQQFLTVRANKQGIMAMGIPEEIAQQAASQGLTPDNVKTFLQQLGSQAGEADFGTGESPRAIQ